MDISSKTRIWVVSVFAIYTAILIAYSFIVGKKHMKQSKDSEYLENFSTGKRDTGPITLAMVLASGMAGAGVFMGIPGYIYTYGSVWFVGAFWAASYTFSSMSILGKKVAIVGRRVNAQSFVELLYHRFEDSRLFTIIASCVVLVFTGTFAVSSLMGGGKLFMLLTGQPYWVGLALFTAVVLISAVFGGFKGVAAAALVQGITMTVCVILMFILGTATTGGVANAIAQIIETDPGWFAPQLPWETIFAFGLLWGVNGLSQPHTMMGFLTYKDSKGMHQATKLALIISFLWMFALNMCIFPSKVLFPDLSSADLALSTLAVTKMPSVMAGLILAGVSAAVQSTLGTLLLALSTTLVRDLFQHGICPKASPKTLKVVTVLGTTILGVVIFSFSINPPALIANVLAIASSGMWSAFMSTVPLAFFWPRYNKQGGIATVLFGIIFYLTMYTGHLTPLALGMNPCIMASVYGLICGVIVTLLTPKPTYGTVVTWFGKDFTPELANSAVR